MEIVVTTHLINSVIERLEPLCGLLIVADPDTVNAAGEDEVTRLSEALNARILLLPQKPKALLSHAQMIAAEAKGNAPAVLGIGSGTINDLVKYAAHEAAIPASILATAPSMNGYSSPTSSLIEGSHKHSFATKAPEIIFTDIELLRHAPASMIAAGVGDVLCRSTVEVDWRLANILRGADYDDAIMAPLREAEEALLPYIHHIKERKPEAIALLWNSLMAGGDAMREHGSSMPASQGEHMIAHAMEGSFGPSGHLHGEEIAVTTLTMSRAQEQLLHHHMIADQAGWIGEHRLSTEQLLHALSEAGCPTHPQAVGWQLEAYTHTVNQTWQTRDRYGFLAFAAEQGIMLNA